MSRMLQIRDVPDEIHNTLKSRAASEGMSLSDFLKRELQRTVEKPSLNEWLERTSHLKPIRSDRTAEQLIREFRDDQ